MVEGGHHGGSWKVAYADFVTAMMAFFLLMWLLNATTEEQRKGLADYFSPNSVLSHNSSGTGQPFGGRTAFSDGAMLSDLGNPQVTVGKQPVVDRVEEDDSGRHRPAAAASRRHGRARSRIWEAGRRRSRRRNRCANAAPAGPVPVAATTAGRGDVQRKPTEAELQAELEKREKQAFEQAAQQIREAVGNDPQLAELARQLAIDMTPEGLRIQIRDADREPMFPLRIGGAERQGQAAAAEGGAGAGTADTGHLDRRPYRRGAVCRLRPHQLGTFRGPCQCHAASVDRVRPAGTADPQCDRQRRTRPCGAQPIRWPPPTAASPIVVLRSVRPLAGSTVRPIPC